MRRCHQTFATIYILTIGFGSGMGTSIRESQLFTTDVTTAITAGGSTSSNRIAPTLVHA